MTRIPKIQFRVYPKIQYRVYLPGKPPFVVETLGLSELAAYTRRRCGSWSWDRSRCVSSARRWGVSSDRPGGTRSEEQERI